MPWIQHYSRFDIKEGLHFYEPHKTALISINDVDEPAPKPKYDFVSTIVFHFEDVVDATDPNSITPHDAKLLGMFLQKMFSEGKNVIVHCHAGVCRSSAVALAGKAIGFTLEPKSRLPNSLVLTRIVEQLGLPIDAQSIADMYLQEYLELTDDEWQQYLIERQYGK